MKRRFALRAEFGRRKLLPVIAALLLLPGLVAAIGAGPDDSGNDAPANTSGQWQAFEGHAFADSRIVPEGTFLVACLGGCDLGYVSEPVKVGKDGRYADLTVAPGATDRTGLPDGQLITFWLSGHDETVPAVQSWLFTGDQSTQPLHLSFPKLPVPMREGGSATDNLGTVTTDLTVPDAEDLGLTPTHTVRSYVNSWAYAGLPILPGLTLALGLLLMFSGVGLLVRRRRLTW